jgi:hypothetical protein
MTMNEQVLKNITVFLNRAAEAGLIKNTLDALAFAEAYQVVQNMLAVRQQPVVSPVTP